MVESREPLIQAEEYPTRKVSVGDLIDGQRDACLWTPGGCAETSTALPRSSLPNAILKYLLDSFLDLDRVFVLTLLLYRPVFPNIINRFLYILNKKLNAEIKHEFWSKFT